VFACRIGHIRSAMMAVMAGMILAGVPMAGVVSGGASAAA
jgi:hypothetical protein